MKRIQGMELKGMHFRVEELTARESANMIDAYELRTKYVDICDAYKKPSEDKVSVWNEWIQWAEDVNMFDDTHEVKNLSICATTCQTFTVCAIIRELDEDASGNYLTGATYIMVVTKSHNYLYRLASDESGEDIDVCW